LAYYLLSPWQNKLGARAFRFYYEGPGLWGHNAEGRVVNLTTDTVVNGRQGFPDVYLLVGAVCVVRAGHAHLLKGESVPAMAGLMLSSREATRIDSLQSLLMYRAMTRTGAPDRVVVQMDSRE
jgi:hypothetical protein